MVLVSSSNHFPTDHPVLLSFFPQTIFLPLCPILFVLQTTLPHCRQGMSQLNHPYCTGSYNQHTCVAVLSSNQLTIMLHWIIQPTHCNVTLGHPANSTSRYTGSSNQLTVMLHWVIQPTHCNVTLGHTTNPMSCYSGSPNQLDVVTVGHQTNSL